MVRVQKLTLFLSRDAMRYSAVFAVVRWPSVHPFVHHVRALYPDGWRYRQTSLSAR